VVHASALQLVTVLTVLLVTAQRAFISFPSVDVSLSPRPAFTRGGAHHAPTPKNARSTRRERRIQPARTLIV